MGTVVVVVAGGAVVLVVPPAVVDVVLPPVVVVVEPLVVVVVAAVVVVVAAAWHVAQFADAGCAAATPAEPSWHAAQVPASMAGTVVWQAAQFDEMLEWPATPWAGGATPPEVPL